uniref:Centrosomal protein 78 n=1 Tax=Periophthalmus magnuspinnatus TaxID=409849 RepID=A0A3B4A043_9GOBI
MISIRRRGAHDFLAYYDFASARQESVPLPAVTMNLDKGMLDFDGDRIKLSDWPPILDSIAINKQLHHIGISSTFQSQGSGDAGITNIRIQSIPAIRSKDMTFKLSKALRDTLTVSPNLKTLQLRGLPLRDRDLIVLTKGLAKSVSLENLSLANCPISDEGLEIICQSVKYSTSIRTVDFTGCNLTWRGAEHMANIIKHQGMQRHGTAWAESLRYRQPHFERMTGLRRVTLNCNTLIGDRGAAALANELSEDLWVKAVDLQRCGLSNEGARRLLEALKTNTTLSVLDIRCNPLIVTEPQRNAALKRRAFPTSYRGKSTLRNGMLLLCIFNLSYRLIRKWTKGALITATCKRAMSLTTSHTVYLMSFQFELENARLRTANLSLSETLANSVSAPAAFSALEDEAVLESIENSFKKFHAFLDLLKDAGLGQLVSMAGLEKSDFQPIGKPQLSSTIGPPPSQNQQVNRFGVMQTEMDPTVKAVSPLPTVQAVVMPTKSSSSSLASFCGDKPLNVTFTQAPRSPEVPGASGEANMDRNSKLIHTFGSEQSIYSQKSFEDLRKTYQTQRSHSPHSKSHHSNSSHRYSDSSHGSGQLSSKSSISEVISERAESVRSSGSRKEDGVSLGFKGRLRSEGSVSSDNDVADILNQITSLRGMGAQSFSTLF